MTRYLLDTAVFIWNVADPSRLRAPVRELLSDPANEIYVSAATPWELAIKVGSGKLKLPESVREFTRKRLAITGFFPLPIAHEHGITADELPPHHRDPFDRILIAQAQAEGLVLITGDENIVRYEVETLWAGKK